MNINEPQTAPNPSAEATEPRSMFDLLGQLKTLDDASAAQAIQFADDPDIDERQQPIFDQKSALESLAPSVSMTTIADVIAGLDVYNHMRRDCESDYADCRDSEILKAIRAALCALVS